MSERLADHTTLGVGGPARQFVTLADEASLLDAIRDCDTRGEPVLILGGGSNLLCGDAGFDGTVLRTGLLGLVVNDVGDAVEVTAACGQPWDDLVELAVAQGWAGIEAMSGIPGLVGATPIQNVGAYGQDAAAVVTAVRALDRRTGAAVDLPASACAFGYRHSAFKDEPGRWVVLAVTYRLTPSREGIVHYPQLAAALGIEAGRPAPIGAIREQVLQLRASKGMLLREEDPDARSAGSFFTNPILDPGASRRLPEPCPRYPAADGQVKVSAAWLIEQAGIDRGWRVRPDARAHVSAKHTLALVTAPGAHAAEVLELARAVRDRVDRAFGIRLTPEVRLVNCTLDG